MGKLECFFLDSFIHIGSNMEEKTWALSLFFVFACLSHVLGDVHSHDHQMRKLQAFKASIVRRDSISPFPSPSPTRFSPSPSTPSVVTVSLFYSFFLNFISRLMLTNRKLNIYVLLGYTKSKSISCNIIWCRPNWEIR